MTPTTPNLFDIAGKVALVTGGSSGVGEMIATMLAAHGAKVYIAARKADQLAAAVAGIAARGQCEGIVANVGDEDGIAALVAEIGKRESGLQILVNNAGATWGAPFAEFPAKGWDRVMDLNVRSVFLLTQALLPMLSAGATDEDWSRVINISSVGAHFTGDSPSAAYGPSKAAVEQLTRVMARSLGAYKVTANCISPGWFPSRMNGPLPAEDREAWRQNTPLGRLGTAEDIGGLAVYLCSRAGTFVNGQTIVSDGGWSA